MFFRSQNLFLRPVWPEDRADLIATMGEGLAPSALRRDEVMPPMLITLPGKSGAALVGIGTLSEEDGQLAVQCQMAPGYLDSDYTAEAVAALRQMALLVG